MKEENQDYLVVGIAFIGAAASALSLVLQKKAHKASETSNKSAYCNFTWLFGLFLFGVAQLLYLGALPFADLVIFSTTGAINLLSNAFFATLILGEVFTRYDLLATVLILAGTTGIVLQTHKGTSQLTRQEIFYLMTQPTQAIILLTFYFYLTFVYYFDQYVDKRINKFYAEAYLASSRYGRNHRLSTTLNESGFLDSNMDQNQEQEQIGKYQPSYSQLIQFIQSQPADVLREISPSFGNLKMFVKWPMLLMALACGMIAATNGVYFKLAGELIKANDAEYTCYADWFWYLFLVLGILGATIQVPLLQVIMSKYNQMESMPTFYAAMILGEIFAGLYLLDEYLYYTKLEVAGIYLAGIICVLGIQVIMKKPVQKKLEEKKEQTVVATDLDRSLSQLNTSKINQMLFDKENQVKERLLPTSSESQLEHDTETATPTSFEDDDYQSVDMATRKEKVLWKLRAMRQAQKQCILLANLENQKNSSN